MGSEEYLKKCLKEKKWDQAFEWTEINIRLYRNKHARQMVVCNTFGALMGIVLAFFTWVVLYPSADKKELEAFPLATICHNLFTKLCETIPGGKVTVIIGLIVIPFLVSAFLALVSLCFRPKKYTPDDHQKRVSASALKDHLKSLQKVHGKYEQGYMNVFLYVLLTCLLTGIVMVISSVPGGMNPFEYVIVGAICALVQAGAFFVCTWIFSWFYHGKFKFYFIYEDLDREIDKGKSSKEPYVSASDRRLQETEYYKEKFNEHYATYMGLEYESPEQKAKRLAAEIEEDLSGKGYGNY